MKLHHIGVACKDVEATTALLIKMGYSAGEIMFDSNQNVNVRFLENSVSPKIELLFGTGEGTSPVDKIVAKNGTSVYHLCYEVDNIKKAVNEMRADGYIPISTAKSSLIEGRNVIFLFNADNVMIELLEGSEHEIKII